MSSIKFKQIKDGEQILEKVLKVNNHTVESDVPANAKFTDTTYETMTAAEATTGTGTTARVITAKVLADKIAEAIASLVDSSPAALDTLNKLAAALNNDPNFATTMATALGNKLGKTETAANAAKVNNLTVQTAVPANAKFTDTTYSNFVKSGSGAKAGLVPAPSTTAGTTKYLREDGTWQVPPDNNTVYTHPTTSGNKHIPSGGSSGQILRWSADGTAVWGNDNNTTYSNVKGATTDADGTAGLVPAPAKGAANRYLRSDGTWQVPPDNNTTYTAASATPKANGTAAVGTSAKYAREDHVHPLQTSVSGSSGSCTGNAATATNLTTARYIDGVSFNGTADINHYGTCSTAAATAAKTVSVTGFKLVTGASIKVKFTNTNAAANPTLNVNSTGAKAIYSGGSAISADVLSANTVIEFVYDGTNYNMMSGGSSGGSSSNMAYNIPTRSGLGNIWIE